MGCINSSNQTPALLAFGLVIYMSTDQPRSSLLRAYSERGIYVVNDGGISARLTSQSQAVVNAYREITSAGAMAGLTLYFVDRWLRDVHHLRVSIWARLLAIAAVKGTPEPSLRDLAASIRGTSEYAVRKHFVQWWESDQTGDPEWEFFRAAVQIESRDGKSYQFRSIVLDDILHGDDLAALDAKVLQFEGDGQGVFRLPSPVALGGSTCLELRPVWNSDPSGTQTGLFVDPSGTQTGQAVPPLHPPSVPMHVQGTSANAEQRFPEPGSGYPDAAAVPGLLAQIGMTQLGIDLVMELPKGPYWAARWCLWITAKTGVDNPPGFVLRRIQGACNGNARDQEPPLAWVTAEDRRRETHTKRQKSVARTAAAVAQRPDPFQALKQKRDAPDRPSSDPDLVASWSEILTEARARLGQEPVEGWLVDAALQRRGEGLAVVVPTPTVRDMVRKKYLPQLNAIAVDVLGEQAALSVVTHGDKQ